MTYHIDPKLVLTMTIKHIAIDIGGTLIEPTSGDWNITTYLKEVLNRYSIYGKSDVVLLNDSFSRAKKLLEPNTTMQNREDEYVYFVKIYDAAINRTTRILPTSEIEKVAYNRVYGEDIYTVITPFFKYINGLTAINKGLFSNTYPSVIYYLKSMGLDSGYVDNCLSYIEGLRKPSPLFFERLLTKTHLTSKSILVVDDNAECINVANALGMNAIYFDKNEIEKCIKEIDRYLWI